MNGSLYLEPWNPHYGSPADLSDERGSKAEVDPGVEIVPEEWHPIGVEPTLALPELVHFVDGVRRIDGRLNWEPPDSPYRKPLIAASYAAGAIRCDLRAGRAELVGEKVERRLFALFADPPTLGEPPACYRGQAIEGRDVHALEAGMQTSMRALELKVADHARIDGGVLFVDGPLQGNNYQTDTLGFVKTHETRYLPDQLALVVAGLGEHQRTPVFKISSPQWGRYSWYTRLPEHVGSGWSGIVRVECPADLDITAAIRFAHLSTAILPRFASVSYKDPRAPQNLVPIAGLEKRLRGLLGDPKVLHRLLMRALAAGVPA